MQEARKKLAVAKATQSELTAQIAAASPETLDLSMPSTIEHLKEHRAWCEQSTILRVDIVHGSSSRPKRVRHLSHQPKLNRLLRASPFLRAL